MTTIGSIQIGKQRITENFIISLKNLLKKHWNVKISVLKSATRNKEEIREFADEIIEKLGKNYTSKIIGFTIFIKKWRKARA